MEFNKAFLIKLHDRMESCNFSESIVKCFGGNLTLPDIEPVFPHPADTSFQVCAHRHILEMKCHKFI